MELSRKQKRLLLGGVGKDHDEETIKDEVRLALKRSSEFCHKVRFTLSFNRNREFFLKFKRALALKVIFIRIFMII